MEPTYPLYIPLTRAPAARADIKGSADYPALTGYANFYPYRNGVFMVTEVWGLPYDTSPCGSNVLGLHLHENGDCAPTGGAQAFSSAGGHFNPRSCPHPMHAGDLPPLFSNHGYAYQGFYSDRLSIRDILGRAIVIHSQRDDFSSQPAGDSGSRIACGIILRQV
ncbi:MAG: superoxide dismutase family protein [Eubacteriales bacterium]|nr:superoxide dismutase family protein [Eubacteriales bacterium]